MTVSDRPTAVLFDFYGTLATGQPKRLYEDVLAEFPRHVAEDILHDIENIVEFPLGLALPEPFQSAEAYSAWLRRQAVERLSEAHLADTSRCDVEDLADALLDCNQVLDLTVLPGAHELLAGLAAQCTRVGICSNWTWDLPDVLDRLGLSAFLDAFVCSACLGASKPAERIYRHALAALGRAPREVLFVGDTYETDVIMPRQLGMAALQVPNDGSGLPALTRWLLGAGVGRLP